MSPCGHNDTQGVDRLLHMKHMQTTLDKPTSVCSCKLAVASAVALTLRLPLDLPAPPKQS